MTLPNDTKITPDLVKQHGLKPDELSGLFPGFTWDNSLNGLLRT